MKDVQARVINFDKAIIKNKETGEVTTMYSVNYAVECDSFDGHFGPIILNSYASEKAFNKLNNSIGKTVKLDILDTRVFGKNNMFKKVVSKIDGVAVRDF